MEKTFIGIDPGAKGFLTAYYPDGKLDFFAIDGHGELEIYKWLKDVKGNSQQTAAVLEDVHSIFGASAKSTFNFGQIKGLLMGLLIANEIPYTLIMPKTWQGELWTNQDMVVSFKTEKRAGKDIKRKIVDTKQTSINAARRLFPGLDLRKSERATKIDDNKVDSLLMAEYARRRNL